MATPTTSPLDREQVRTAVAELLMPGGLPAKPAVLSRVAFVRGQIADTDVAGSEKPYRLAVLTAHMGQVATRAVGSDDYVLSLEVAKVAAIALAWLDQLDIEEVPF